MISFPSTHLSVGFDKYICFFSKRMFFLNSVSISLGSAFPSLHFLTFQKNGITESIGPKTSAFFRTEQSNPVKNNHSTANDVSSMEQTPSFGNQLKTGRNCKTHNATTSHLFLEQTSRISDWQKAISTALWYERMCVLCKASKNSMPKRIQKRNRLSSRKKNNNG